MNIKPIATAAAVAGLLACASPSFAAPVTIDFEGANGQGFVTHFYDGGTDEAPDSTHPPVSGPNYQITFGHDALALVNDGTGYGPNGEFYSNAPSPGTIMAPISSNASMFAANGTSFIDSLSFYYSSLQDFSVDILDGTDSVIGTLDLLANSGGCVASTLCVWSLASTNFEGAAKSIRFGSGFDASAGFDDITVTSVPVPAAGWLLASGLAVLGRMRRKRANAGALSAA
jgi:hypothetical protein